MTKLNKSYKSVNYKTQRGGMLMCPSDLTAGTSEQAKVLKAFVESLKMATSVEQVATAFGILKSTTPSLSDVIIAMPDEFCKLLGSPRAEVLKAMLGADGKVSELLKESLDLTGLVGNPDDSTPAGAGAPAGDEDDGPAGAGTGAGAVGGGKKRKTSKKTSKTPSKKSSKRTSKKGLKGGAKKVSKKVSKKLSKKTSKKTSKKNSKKGLKGGAKKTSKKGSKTTKRKTSKRTSKK